MQARTSWLVVALTASNATAPTTAQVPPAMLGGSLGGAGGPVVDSAPPGSAQRMPIANMIAITMPKNTQP